jgi:hypothetical protein
MWNEHFVKIFSNMANMNVMNVADCYVANALATTYDFSVTFRDIGEVFNVELKSNIANIDVLKFKIEYMYAYKYGKSIKIREKNYYGSYIDLASDSVGYDDATKKYHWKELESNNGVQFMFSTIKGDQTQDCLYATLKK